MSYSSFTLSEIAEKFQVKIEAKLEMFSDAEPREISSWLKQTLEINENLAYAINTEKARSELIVMPVLVELREQLNKQMSLFSGVDFTVDIEQGLNGICDFLISKSPQQLYIESAVIALVEAKKQDLSLAYPQCSAEMIAARIFNDRKGNNIKTIFGVATTGSSWQFMRYIDDKIEIDSREYSIESPEKILGILWQMISAD